MNQQANISQTSSIISVDGNPELERLLALPAHDRKQQVCLPKQKTVFHLPLSAYPIQPWEKENHALAYAKKQEQVENAHRNLSQWFNYGFTPKTWESYASHQLEVLSELDKSLQ